MANDNKNSNELVDTDDDPTEELEVLAIHAGTVPDEVSNASPAGPKRPAGRTRDAYPDPAQQVSPAIDRLESELDRMRSRAAALETAIVARDKSVATLSQSLESADQELAARNRDLEQRDQRIEALQSDLDGQRRAAEMKPNERRPAETADGDPALVQEIEALKSEIERLSGGLAGRDAEYRELEEQLQRNEAYADLLRRELTDLAGETDFTRTEKGTLSAELERANSRIEEVETELAAARAAEASAADALAEARAEHEQELRTLRFELGEAENSHAQVEHVNDKLLSDLVDARSFRNELKRLLQAHDEHSQARVENFKQQISALETTVAEFSRDIEDRRIAIESIMDEIRQRESPDRADETRSPAPLESNQHTSGEVGDRTSNATSAFEDGVARLLIGRFNRRELRFPLFKDRLTIGRTGDNDIQLKARHISRRHAVICSNADATRIIDWESRNGVFVNSERVTEHFLKNGDIVTIGDAEFRYEERTKHDA